MVPSVGIMCICVYFSHEHCRGSRRLGVRRGRTPALSGAAPHVRPHRCMRSREGRRGPRDGSPAIFGNALGRFDSRRNNPVGPWASRPGLRGPAPRGVSRSGRTTARRNIGGGSGCGLPVGLLRRLDRVLRRHPRRILDVRPCGTPRSSRPDSRKHPRRQPGLLPDGGSTRSRAVGARGGHRFDGHRCGRRIGHLRRRA